MVVKKLLDILMEQDPEQLFSLPATCTGMCVCVRNVSLAPCLEPLILENGCSQAYLVG